MLLDYTYFTKCHGVDLKPNIKTTYEIEQPLKMSEKLIVTNISSLSHLSCQWPSDATRAPTMHTIGPPGTPIMSLELTS